MEPFAFVLSIVVIRLLANMAPSGPDFFIVTKNALKYSRQTGVWTAVGIGLSNLFHIGYCLLGLAIVITKSILWFNVVKFLGAAYLIYLGVEALLSKKTMPAPQKTKPVAHDLTVFQAIASGFLVNIVNPKTTLFFLSLFSVVLTPDISLQTQIIASACMVVTTTSWFTVLAIAFSHHKIQTLFYRYEHMAMRIFGTILIGLGLKITFLKQK